VPRGLCIARHTTAYSHTLASKALTACCTAPPMFTDPTWIGQFQHRHHAVDRHDRDAVHLGMPGCRQLRIGRQPIDVGKLQPRIRDRLLNRRQCMSRERDFGRACDLRKPDTADRHLAPVFPHEASPSQSTGALRAAPLPNPPLLAGEGWGGGAKRNCGKVMSSFSFSKTTSTAARPSLRCIPPPASSRRARRGGIVEFDDDGRVGHRGREGFVRRYDT
jgi:hypothetical protein